MRHLVLALLVACSPPPAQGVTALCDVDAPAQVAPDVLADVAVDLLGLPWPRHEIFAGLLGADGADEAVIGGARYVVTPWEDSARVTVSRQSGGTWQTVTIPHNVGAAEDAKIAGDLDGDGNAPDVVTASENGRGYIHFAPPVTDLMTPSAWATVEIGSALVTGNRWMQVALGDVTGDGAVDVCLGGRAGSTSGAVGKVACFTSATPRIAASWTRLDVADAGWTMSLVAIDWDADGDQDLWMTDRAAIGADYTRRGSRVLVNGGGGAWSSTPVAIYANARFGHVASASKQLDGSATSTTSALTLRTRDAAGVWTATPVPYPTNVGQYHDVEPGDVDGDGIEDLVLSHAYTTGTQSGVVYLRGPDFTERGEISGEPGSKHDNVLLRDLDDDGDLDVLDTEQIDGLGLGWYENPWGGS